MNRLTSLLIKSALVTALLAAFSGVAVAGGGHGSSGTAPGNSANAPGQQKQQAAPATSPGNSANAPGQQRKQGGSTASAQTSHPSHPTHPAHPTQSNSASAHSSHSSSKTSSSAFANPAGKPRHNVPSGAVAGQQQHPESFGGPGNSGTHKYTVCHNGHAITVDVHSWNAHVVGHGDTLLPYGTKGKQACGTTATQPTTTESQQQQQSCPVSVVVDVIVGVMHHTGSKTNPTVLIHPNAHSSHFANKHPDEVVKQSVTQTVAGTCGPAGTTVSPASIGNSTNVAGGTNVAATGTQAGTQAGTVATAGVKGASIVKTSGAVAAKGKGAAKPSHGVLGAASRAGRAVGTTVTKGQLPFTGFPVWAALLIAAGLLAGGFALRRFRTTA